MQWPDWVTMKLLVLYQGAGKPFLRGRFLAKHSSQDELRSSSLQGLLHGGCRNENLAVKCCSERNKTLTLKMKKHEIDTILLGQEAGNTRRIMKWLHIANFCEYSDIWRPLVFIWNKQWNKTRVLNACQSQALGSANMLISQAVYVEMLCFHAVCWLELGPWRSQVINLQGFIFPELLMSSVSEQQAVAH